MTLIRFFFTWTTRFCEKPIIGEKSDPLVDLVIFGGVMFAFRAFDGVTDPIAGTVADRWVRKGKERRRLLWYFFLIPVVGFVLCFMPTLEMAPWLRWLFLVGGMFVFFVGYTFYAIPYWSLIGDYGKNDDERRLMSNLLGVGMLLATAAGTVASGLVINKLGFRTAAIVYGIPTSVLLILPIFAQPADAKPLPPSEEEGPGLLQGVWVALKHKRFLATLFLFAGSQMSFTVMTICVVKIVELVLGSGKTAEADVAIVMGAFLGTSLLSLAFVPWCSRKLGWEKACVIASVLLGGVYGLTAFLGQGIIGSPLTTGALLFSLGGPMSAVLLGLEGEAVTDCARERGGEDQTALYFGVYNFVVKCFNGLAFWLSAKLVALSSESQLHVTGARMMGPIAGGLLVVGVVAYFVTRRLKDEPPPPPEPAPDPPEPPTVAA